MKYDIKTIEGALHVITITVNDGVDFTNYSVYGSCGGGCCCKHFIIEEQTNTQCKVVIPALSRGVYDYQLFAKQNDTNKEFLIISGQVIAEDRICDNANNSIDYKTTVADVTISADTVEVSVTIQGIQGEEGGYYIPTVSADGNLSWTATESDMPTVATVNIRGPQGPAGEFDTSILEDYATIAYVDEAVEGAGGGGGSSSFDMAAYNAFYGKYYNCVMRFDVNDINSDYQNDLTYKGEWIYDLSNLNGGDFMYEGCENLTSWNAPLSRLFEGRYMFRECTNLTSFISDLTNLDNGYYMFEGCSNLTEWNIDLPNLTNGESMFSGCYKLTSFEGDLSKLTNGLQMFSNCRTLSSFSADLSSLTDGTNMFGVTMLNCSKLDLASVQHIANTINDLTAAGTTGTIHIGMQRAIQFNADKETAIAAIEAKGWTVNEIYGIF